MSFLLDTCIISKLRKIKHDPNPLLSEWFMMYSEENYFLSVLTIGEIEDGISRIQENSLQNKKSKALLSLWLNDDLIPRFKSRIITIDINVSLMWGKVKGEKQKQGINIPVVDGLIAASALVHNLTLVTENISDFLETGARLMNPLERSKGKARDTSTTHK